MDLIICAGLAVSEYVAACVTGTIESAGRFRPQATVLALITLHYLAVKYYRVFLYHKYFSPLRHIPGPENNHPFFGQAINLLKANSPPELYVKWMKQYPDEPFIRYLSFANTEILLCNSLSAHKGVLQTHCYTFKKPDRWRRMMTEITGSGIVGLEGDEHHKHRRILAGVFSVSNVRKLEPVFESKAEELGKLLDQTVAASDGVFDCTDVFSKATLDIIGVTIMGVELSNLKSAQQKDSGNRQWNLKHAVRAQDYTFHDAYEIIFAASMLGKILFFANGFFPTRWIPVEANREFMFATRWLRQVITKLIKDRYREVDEARSSGKYETMKKDSRDLLSFLVEESVSGGPAVGIEMENFLGHILQLMAAGHATSADTVSWAVYTMATRHDIQDRLHAEVKDMTSRQPDFKFSDIDALPYLNNFIKENLRLYAASTSHHRQASKDVIIDGVLIPKDTTIDIVPAVPMLNPLIWGEDADYPRPERWDHLTGDQLSPYAFEAFSNGPRMCIGKSYAYMEIKIILVELIQRFKFVSVNSDFTVENPGFALRPCGMVVRVEKRAL